MKAQTITPKIKKNVLTLVFSLFIPLAVGAVSSLLTNKAMIQFQYFNKPALSPPGWLFPIVWTLLYLVMGLAFYFVLIADKSSEYREKAIWFFVISLFFNFMWSIIFFNMSEFLIAFIWLIAMLAIIVITTINFFKVDKTAGYMMLPYIAWTTFAGYLNLGIYILSRTPAIMPR